MTRHHHHHVVVVAVVVVTVEGEYERRRCDWLLTGLKWMVRRQGPQ